MASNTTNLELTMQDGNDLVDPTPYGWNFGTIASLFDRGGALTGGISSGQRENANQNMQYTSGDMYFQYFTSYKGQMTMPNGTYSVELRIGGTTGAGLTYAEVGLYDVSPVDGKLTLVASTANSTDSFTSAYSGTTLNWQANYAIQNAKRYAVGVLFVGTTVPSILNIGGSSDYSLNSLPPRLCGKLSAQTALPTTVQDSQLETCGGGPFAILH